MARTIATTITLVYLFLALMASLPLAIYPGNPFAGLFLVLIALPWTFILSPLLDAVPVSDVRVDIAALWLGVGLNALVLFFGGQKLWRLIFEGRNN